MCNVVVMDRLPEFIAYAINSEIASLIARNDGGFLALWWAGMPTL